MNVEKELVIVRVHPLAPSKKNGPPYQAVIFKDEDTGEQYNMWLNQWKSHDFNWERWQPYLKEGYVLRVQINQNGNVHSTGPVERVYENVVVA